MRKSWSRSAIVGFLFALVVAALAAISGFGHRWGWWDFSEGFWLLKQAFYGSFVAAIISVVGVVVTRPGAKPRGFVVALCGLVVSGAVAYVPWNEMQKVRTLPPLHDITTDTDNPPEFVAALPLRGDTSNSVVYAGAAVAALQRGGYPDIEPLITKQSTESMYAQSLAVAKGLGWEIVAADSVARRIEATDTTFWYGFKDDVVIRITTVPEGTRVDIRSISRVGGSDVGANAARIRAFFRALGRTDPANINRP